MPVYRLTIEYDGTRYSGWQAQRNARTVQGALVEVIRSVAGECDLGGAGRTDAGVHAIAQVAHLRLRRPCDVPTFLKAVNGRLPQDINVTRMEGAAARFHARHDAIERSYLYQVGLRRSAFHKRYIWWVKEEVDEEMIARRQKELLGVRDFSAFSDKRRDPEESGKVHVHECTSCRAGDLLLFRFGGSHFLWKMVRRIVGVLIAIGTRRLPDAPLAEIALRTDIAQLTAPASGLFLEYVRYAGDPPPPPIRPFTPF